MNEKLLKTSGTEVLSSRKKLRKTLWGVASIPPPPPSCASEGKEVVVSILACQGSTLLGWKTLTYQAAKIWNSLESDVSKENLSKLAMSIKSKSF